MLSTVLHFSKGDIKNATKFLERFVSVAERAGLQDSLADACSAIGTMCNTMVSEKCLQSLAELKTA